MDTINKKNFSKVTIRFEDLQREYGFEREYKNEMDIVGASLLKSDEFN